MEELASPTRPPDLAGLLAPRSITLVGASDKSYFSQQLAENLIGASSIPVNIVNPGREKVHDLRVFKSMSEIEGGIDQVIALMGTRSLEPVLEEAASLGCRSSVVIGTMVPGDPAAPQLADLASRLGIALLGTGSLGYIGQNGHLNALASRFTRPPIPGPLAVVSQSGGLAVAAARLLDDLGTGISLLATVGGETSIDVSAFLHHAVEDPITEAILLLVEGIRNPGEFMNGLERARLAGKPVIVHKLGQSRRGTQMALTHTGALAGNRETFEAVCRRFDATSTSSLDDAVDISSALLRMPTPTGGGNGVFVVTASGAAGIAAADAAEKVGVELPAISDDCATRLNEILPDFASASNPLDVTAQVRTDSGMFGKAVTTVLGGRVADVVLFATSLGLPDSGSGSHQASFEEVAKVASSNVPVVAASVARTPVTTWGREFLIRTGLPYTRSLESAFRAVAAWRRLGGHYAQRPQPAIRRRSYSSPSRVLDEVESKEVLRSYGIGSPNESIARGADEAIAVAYEIGFPVSIKIVAHSIPHKAAVGGVHLDVRDPESVRLAVEAVNEVAGDLSRPLPATLLISQMVEPLAEVMLGGYVDEQFGPMVLCGRGGQNVETLGVRPSVGLAPLDHEQASYLLQESGVLETLASAGVHNHDPIIQALVAVARLVSEHSLTIRSIDVNPMAVLKSGDVVALDALIERQSNQSDHSSE